MLNVIVSSGLTNKDRGSILVERVFVFTDEAVQARFLPLGNLDTTAVRQFPTLFMEEGRGNEAAGIGWLTQIRRKGREYHYLFQLDPDIPQMTNAEVYAMMQELEMEEFQFTRNHWSIKDVDLFEILYRRKAEERFSPTVFQLSKKPTNPKLISFMMPFSGGFADVYADTKAALESEGYLVQRADDIWVHSHIMADIIELICTSSVVICDLSGKNPNVFYEAGVAHTLGKNVVLITQSHEDVPFDLKPLRYIHYLGNREGREKLVGEVLARVKTLTET